MRTAHRRTLTLGVLLCLTMIELSCVGGSSEGADSVGGAGTKGMTAHTGVTSSTGTLTPTGATGLTGVTEGFRPVLLHSDTVPTCGPTGLARDSAIANGSFPEGTERWDTWYIPEFQDDQRFVSASDTTYGPLVCSVTAPDLATYSMDQFAAPGGKLVAILFVDTIASTAASPVVLPQAYRNLNLQPQFNCVILRRETLAVLPTINLVRGFVDSISEATTPATRRSAVAKPPGPVNASKATIWRGYVVPSHQKQCEPIDDSPSLVVTSRSWEGAGPDNIPPVSRFVVRNDWMVGIGFRCLVAWCTIGAKPSEIRAVAHAASATGPKKWVESVDGWYDDQNLAVEDPTKPLRMSPKSRAVVIPHPDLDKRELTAYDDWAEVATIKFVGKPTGKYETKWKFKEDGEVVMKLMRVERWQFVWFSWFKPFKGEQYRWKAMIDGVENTDLKVHRTDHSGRVHIWGTARWAWLPNDEGIWVRCGDGCCLSDPDS